MSEQMSAGKLAEAINQALLMSPTPLRWQNAEAIILADRKATVERCKDALVIARLNFGLRDSGKALLAALDAVLEDAP